jgi:hypothetical protein
MIFNLLEQEYSCNADKNKALYSFINHIYGFYTDRVSFNWFLEWYQHHNEQ